MAQVVINNLAQYGVISDIAPFQSPPNAWTSARNVSFESGGVSKSGNRSEVMVPTTEVVNKIYNKSGKVYYTTGKKVYQATGVGNVDVSKGLAEYTATDEWFVTELSNVLVFVNESEVPQMFLPTDSELSDLTGWGVENPSEEGDVIPWRTSRIRAYKNFLVAIGMIEDGKEYTQRVRWSDLALPNEAPPSWDATDTTKSAGFNDLSEARGKLVDGLVMGDYFILYTTQEVFLVSYVGGNNIFSFRKVFDNVSILAPECAAPVNGGHFVVTTSDVIIHNGSSWQSIITDKIKQNLFSAIGNGDPNKVKVQAYPAKNEIWVLYPSSKGANLDRAAIYNLDNGTWTFRELPSLTAISYGVIPSDDDKIIDTQTQIIDTDDNIINGVGQDFVKGSLFASATDLVWWAIDEGVSGTVNLPCSMIKQNLDFDDWGVEATQHKQIKAIYPQFQGSGVVNISVGIAENPYDAPRWSESVPFTIGSDRKADFRVTGRYISVRFEGFESASWTLMSYGIDGAPRGMK